MSKTARVPNFPCETTRVLSFLCVEMFDQKLQIVDGVLPTERVREGEHFAAQPLGVHPEQG